jgi:hypothetical protein
MIFLTGVADVADWWGSVGGYAGIALCALALAGVFGPKDRKLRLMLAVWVLLAWGATYGWPLIGHTLVLLPMVKITAFFRYLAPAWEFALAVLAAMAVDDLLRSQSSRRILSVSALMTFALTVFGVYQSVSHFSISGPPIFWKGTLVFGLALFLALFLVLILRMSVETRCKTLAALAIAEAMIYFVIPTLSYPKSSGLEVGGIEFLRENLGLQRSTTSIARCQ